MERETGAKIVIRGKGSVKEGRVSSSTLTFTLFLSPLSLSLVASNLFSESKEDDNDEWSYRR
jgi:hypothetical protein